MTKLSGRASAHGVVAVADLREFFRESIDEAIANQRVSVDAHTTHYVVNVLTLFSRSEEFYEDSGEVYGLKPLAMMLLDATEARSAAERSAVLQRLGDVALFVSGFFADSLAHKLVDLDYYVKMGGTAYGSLSEEIRGTARGRALADVYEELARKFQIVVDVLNEVRDGVQQGSDIDLLRTYEVWLKTGSNRAAALLRQNGIVPMAQPGLRQH
ncbi:hypothetical protein [Woeseia oceani]|uniref:Uncharacterized protein n=1 Tax=Woeseia oceani TaxID=1548547 RepID=A0A193LCQ2_9GAMM|nr:hypothetical protein [Woeseia oceani]ANO50226.1 hypothetical protein BA177_02435 [Woeseia oceani]